MLIAQKKERAKKRNKAEIPLSANHQFSFLQDFALSF
jgi:hypothetical protein